MASQPSNQNNENPFDVSRIRQLVKLMRDNELSEIDLRLAESRIRLRRGPDNGIITTLAPAPAAAAPASPAPSATAEPESKGAKPSNETMIKSPIVGTFYSAPNPDAEPFVSVGSKVTKDSTVCIIEAMKVFNEIPAGVAGTIKQVLAENGSVVEYDTPLFVVDPTG